MGTAPSGFVWMGVLFGWVYSPGGCGFRGISKLMISPGSLPISCGGSEAVAGMPEGSTTWKDVGCTSGASPTPGGLCGSIKSMGPLATLMASTAAATASSSELSVDVPGLPPDDIRLRTVLPRKAGGASPIEIPYLE